MREILTPAVWKEIHRVCRDHERERWAWSMNAMLLVSVGMAMCVSGTRRRRFEEARAFATALRGKRRRCGETLEGYIAALRALPMELFGVLRGAVQRRVEEAGLDVARVGRWLVFGMDGTKQTLARMEGLTKYFGIANKDPGGPERLVVGAVALGRNMLWDWAADVARGSERELALKIVERLPLGCMGVFDAGFGGYEWIRSVVASGRHVLVRVGSSAQLLVEGVRKAQREGGEVWWWPMDWRSEAPLRLRLIRLERTRWGKRKKGKGKKKWREVLWLVTDVMDAKALTDEEAREMFARRWPGNECTYRSWKCTLKANKLLSRAPETALRESEWSLWALMLLEAMALLKAGRLGKGRAASVAEALKAWQWAVDRLREKKSTRGFGKKISEALVDNYRRRGPKTRQTWPRRKDHAAPKAPRLRKLTPRVKTSGIKKLREIAA